MPSGELGNYNLLDTPQTTLNNCYARPMSLVPHEAGAPTVACNTQDEGGLL